MDGIGIVNTFRHTRILVYIFIQYLGFRSLDLCRYQNQIEDLMAIRLFLCEDDNQ